MVGRLPRAWWAVAAAGRTAGARLLSLSSCRGKMGLLGWVLSSVLEFPTWLIKWPFLLADENRLALTRTECFSVSSWAERFLSHLGPLFLFWWWWWGDLRAWAGFLNATMLTLGISGRQGLRAGAPSGRPKSCFMGLRAGAFSLFSLS